MNGYVFQIEDINVASWGGTKRGGWSLDDRVGIQVIHLPTGTVVQVDTEDNIYKNRSIALEELNNILINKEEVDREKQTFDKEYQEYLKLKSKFE